MKITIVKSIATTFAFMLFLTVSSFAQKGKNISFEDRAEKRTEKMVKHLALDVTQESQVAAINLDYANQLADIRDADTPREEKKAAIVAIKKSYNAEMEDVLNEEQFAKFRKAQLKRKRGKGEREIRRG